MAEVQVKEQGGGKKNKQKKQHLRVDFTPMVDMNMLLITFFMFCTTLLKPQTMNINMPTKDKPTKENNVRASSAITLLLGANDELYYYLGLIDSTGSSYNDPNFLVKTDYTPGGLRKLLLEKNKGTYQLIEDLKEKQKKLEITEAQFNEQTAKIQSDAMKVAKIAPTVMIKATDQSTYKNLVDALDEMLVCNIGAYAIVDLEKGDRYLLFKKTNNSDYLADDQRAQAAAPPTTVRK